MGLEWGQFIRVPLFYLGLLDPGNLSPWDKLASCGKCESVSHSVMSDSLWPHGL